VAVARRIVVRGRVQGVNFRDATRRKADQLGVAGWVRNRSDGAVEIAAEGEPDAVESLVAYAREGPRSASVDDVEVSDSAPEGLSGFDVR